MDPATCQGCHEGHYREWSGSMHAYAADDPLFLANNARGQRETKGALGDFCVRCHAPVAVAMGATKDGLNLASLPPSMKGITCYACHAIDSLVDQHNGQVHLAEDGVMRGGITDPLANSAHKAGYGALQDHEQIGSAGLCGSCHDVKNANGVDLARTFAEWKGSLFAHDVPGQKLTCSACHMPGHDGPAAKVDGAPVRRVHDHSFPAVDVALTPFPQADAQKAAVQANLDPALLAKLCVTPKLEVQYTLDDAFAGHNFPSGAAYHRRAWAEIVAKNAGAVVWSTGVVPDDQATSAIADPNLWLLGDHMKDASGGSVEMLWSAQKVDSVLLPPAVTNVKTDPAYYHSVTKTFDLSAVTFDTVEAKVHLRPVDRDFVHDLVSSGDLDPSYESKLVTFTLAGTVLSWSKSTTGFGCVP